MKSRFALLAVLLLAVFGTVSLTVLAHEGRTLGEYQIYFGWRNEPAYTGLFNGPEVFVGMAGAEEGAAFPADIEVSLQTEVTFGPETKTLTLEPAYGESGHYIADLIPTLPGDYTFRVFGKIGDTEVNETFTSADGQFGSVEPGADILFPVSGSTDIAALLERIDDLEARVKELEGK